MAGDIAGTTIPLTGIYKQQQAQAEQAYQEALAQINQQSGQTLQSFGFKGNFDPTSGVLKGYEMDPGNPFGSVQQLRRSFGAQRENTKESVYARGLDPYSGLGARQGQSEREDFDFASVQMGRSFLDAWAGNTQARTDARQVLSSQMLAAQQGAIEQSMQERMYKQAESQFQQQLAQSQQQFDASQQMQQQQFAQQMAMSQQQASGGGGYGDPMYDPYAGMQPETQPDYGGLPTITSYEAQVMQQYGPMKGKNRPDWVKEIFQANPGFLSGAQQYVLIG